MLIFDTQGFKPRKSLYLATLRVILIYAKSES